MNEWISVKDRLPKKYTKVLVWYEYFRYGNYNKVVEDCETATYVEDGRFLTTGKKAKVTHWMPLPKSPKED